MNRQQWQQAYRDARKFDRFQHLFWDRIRNVATSFHARTICPGFEATRLSGDWLRYPSITETPDYKLVHLRHPVRLPA